MGETAENHSTLLDDPTSRPAALVDSPATLDDTPDVVAPSAPSILSRRRHPGRLLLAALGAPLVVALLTVLAVGIAFGTSLDAALVSDSPAAGSTRPAADVDYEGLSAMFSGDIGGGGTDAAYDRARDALIYYSRHGGEPLSWPVADGMTTDGCYCFNAAFTHCLILATGDFTITVDSAMSEVRREYGKGDSESLWPWDMWRHYERTVGLRHKEHFIGKNGVTRENFYEGIKEALQKGHPIMAGCGADRQLPFYNYDGTTRLPPNGHSIMFYKYEDGVFYAKDWNTASGPSVEYSEHGGKIDVYDWWLNSCQSVCGGVEFWCEDESGNEVKPTLRVPGDVSLPSEDEVGSRATGRAKVTRLDSEQTWDGGSVSLASESVSPSWASEDDGLDSLPDADEADNRQSRLVAAAGVVPAGSSSSSWLASVFREAGMSPPPVSHACEWLVGLSGGSDAISDPAMSSLRPGMIIGSPSVAGSAGERIWGHVGLCVGGGKILHVVEQVEASQSRYFSAELDASSRLQKALGKSLQSSRYM